MQIRSISFALRGTPTPAGYSLLAQSTVSTLFLCQIHIGIFNLYHENKLTIDFLRFIFHYLFSFFIWVRFVCNSNTINSCAADNDPKSRNLTLVCIGTLTTQQSIGPLYGRLELKKKKKTHDRTIDRQICTFCRKEFLF